MFVADMFEDWVPNQRAAHVKTHVRVVVLFPDTGFAELEEMAA